MSLAMNIREQILKSYRVEQAEHIQTMTDGLLALEQGRADKNTLDTAYRAAHSLKGAARAIGVTVIEQIAHALETLLDGLRKGTLAPEAALFTACYHAFDTIQLVQASYEAGETTPPAQSLVALAELDKSRFTQLTLPSADQPVETPAPAAVPIPPVEPTPAPAPRPVEPAPAAVKPPPPAARPADLPRAAVPAAEPANPSAEAGNGASAVPQVAYNDATVRIEVEKLDALVANLSDLLVARIRLEERQAQIRQLQEMLTSLQKSWMPVRGPFGRLTREQMDGMLSLHRQRSVDLSPRETREGDLSRNRLRERNWMGGMSNGFEIGELKHMTEVSKDAAQLLRYVNNSQEQLHAISAMVNEISQQYAADTTHLSLIITELEDEIKRMRMLPFSTITGTFARMLRDLAVQSGKEAVLNIQGGDTEVDKRILEGIKDPLMHLLRNALDHGVEKPEIRQTRGKPRNGQITLSAEQRGKEVVISVSDDGNGLDMEAINTAVVSQNTRSGINTGGQLGEAELIDSIFNMGISTSPIITDVSGRGVGLNVVRNNIEALHGQVDVESRPGVGTTFVLTLPLALTGSRSLMIECAGQLFAIPINQVDRSLYLSPDDIFILEGHDTIQVDGRPVPLVSLSDILELSAGRPVQAEGARLCAVVLTIDEKRLMRQSARQVAFLVDELVGEQEVVIKSLGRQLSRVAGIAGATVLGSGVVVLILNAVDLMKMAARPGQRLMKDTLASKEAPQEQRRRRRILVVDDSITTRTLEKNILDAAGYTVLLATDGTEALSIIRSTEKPDLVVTDIVMPLMDGFELTREIKEDAQTQEIPVILVTSLDSQEDKEHGIKVHADAYIVKSSFDQVNLLETIAQLI